MAKRWSPAEDARLVGLVADSFPARTLDGLTFRPVHTESSELGWLPCWDGISAALGRPKASCVARYRKLVLANEDWHYTCPDTGILMAAHHRAR